MAILWLGFARPHRAVSQQEPALVPKTVLGTRSSAFGQRTSRKKTRRLQRLSLWRDPDSNRGHHDFQGRADMPGRDGKALQIGRSQVGRAARRYPWFPVVPGGLRTWRCRHVLFVGHRVFGARAPARGWDRLSLDPRRSILTCSGTLGGEHRVAVEQVL